MEYVYDACVQKDSIDMLAAEITNRLGETLEAEFVLLFYRIPGALNLIPISMWRWEGEDLPELPKDHPLVVAHQYHHDIFEVSGAGEELAKQYLTSWKAHASFGLFSGDEVSGLIVFGWENERRLNKSEKTLLQRLSERLSAAFDVFSFYQQQREVQNTLTLKNKVDQLTQISASLHHDILNPLNILSMKCQIFERKHILKESNGDLKRSAEDLTKLVLQHVDRLAIVTQRLGQFVRQNRGQLRIEGLLLSNMLNNCVDIIGPDQFAADNIAIELQLENPDVEVYGDGVLLEQVFLNLLLRSYQSIGKQGRIRVTSYEPDAFTVVVVINDTGMRQEASPEHIVTEVESPLKQDLNQVCQESESSGLNLMQRYVEMMRGNLEYRAPLTGGNQYIVTLVKRWERKHDE